MRIEPNKSHWPATTPAVPKPNFHHIVPDWKRILGALVALFPLPAMALLSLILLLMPSLKAEVQLRGPVLPFALPIGAGFQIVFILTLWAVVLVYRLIWRVRIIGWEETHEIRFWCHFLAAAWVSAMVANTMLGDSSAQDRALGITYTLHRYWPWPTGLVFLLIFLPWAASWPKNRIEPETT